MSFQCYATAFGTQTCGHFFCTPAQQETAPAPAQGHGAPSRRGGCRQRVQQAEGHAGTPRGKSPLHLLKAVPNAPTRALEDKACRQTGWRHAALPRTAALSFLPVKMHVFSAILQAWLSQKFKVSGDRSVYSNAVSVLGCVLWEDQLSIIFSELSSP